MSGRDIALVLGGAVGGWLIHRYAGKNSTLKKVDAKAEQVTQELEKTFNELLDVAASKGASAAEVKRALNNS